MIRCQNTKRKLYITRKKTIPYSQANIERSKIAILLNNWVT